MSKCNCLKFPLKVIFVRTADTQNLGKRWNKKRIKAWMQLIDEIFVGTSQLLSVSIEPFDTMTIAEAKNVTKICLGT